MVDPNCGIQTWFLRPSFIFKIFWGLFAAVTLVRMILIDIRLYKHVWRKAVQNGNMACVVTFFFILAIIVTILIHFNSVIEKIPFIGTNVLHQVIAEGVIGGFTLIFALVFGCKCVRGKYYNEITDQNTGKFWVYWKDHSTDEKYIEWLKKYQNSSQKIKYFKDRTYIPGLNALGLFITLAILDSVVLFYFCHERKTGGFRPVTDQSNEYLNSSPYENITQ